MPSTPSHQPVDPTVEHAKAQHHAEEHDHPSYMFYVWIGVILTVITAAEVGVFYVEALQGVLVPLLLVMSLGKFILVVMFYMHLKQDSRIFTGVFAAPLALAVFLVVALIILFKLLPTGRLFG